MKPSVGQIVRSRRESLGLTLESLARAVGATKSYLSMIENQRVQGPPSRGLVEALERALSIERGELLRAADWESTPAPVRRAMEDLESQARRGRELAAWLKEQTRARRREGRRTLDELHRSGELKRRVNEALGDEAESGPEGPGLEAGRAGGRGGRAVTAEAVTPGGGAGLGGGDGIRGWIRGCRCVIGCR